MAELKKGCQNPTISVALPYKKSFGKEAVKYYNETGRTAQKWQANLLNIILAVNEEGLWVHTKYGYSVPRRNGKNEIVSMRELFGLKSGERILHTAHRTTTSHAAAERLAKLLNDSGYEEVQRVKKGVKYTKHYVYSKQFGLEKITLLETGGVCDFRTRTSKGGLGEGFDLLIIDEAQEYTNDQESSLKYVVSDSKNPQTIMCGTPPTAVSSGDIFPKYRSDVLAGTMEDSGWAEWSVPEQSDPHDKKLWYQTNPSLGTILTERKISAEIGSDEVDFNIQRLGLWISYDQKSDITSADWSQTQVDKKPKLTGKLFVGIKYGKDGTNVAVTVACKTSTGRIFISAYDCKNRREGNGWIIKFLKSTEAIEKIVVDGAGGQEILAKEMKDADLKKPIFPTVKEIIIANQMFEKAVFNDGIRHMEQQSLDDSVTHCEKRAIGANGGFGYKSTSDVFDIALMDSAILAFWICSTTKVKKKQTIMC